MKLTRPFATIALVTATFLVACASGSEDLFSDVDDTSGEGEGGAGGEGGAAGTGGAGTTTTTSSGPVDTCAPSCTQDSDCATTCAAVPNTQANCCDVDTGTCYVYDASLCPVPDPGTGGGPPNPY
ncbi:hypothetical protein [Chondromyces apiculatus]|uniref:Uncharacterized protein n=1 Tax=Chondromyces apiculatus DSM 436 TaxID=1192034 RepID=A0A017T3G0_9BACT|nr:hypothetical protein [Chondromyces apiculatus]EYF03385.1 Hypothetical protein CAP_5578 [Chondromyces apiculatus DSM 436]